MRLFSMALMPLLVVFLISPTGCSPDPGPPDLVGIVESVSFLDDGGATLLVEGDPDAGYQYYLASVRVGRDTPVYLTDGSRGTPEDLTTGLTLKIWFDGPVAESWPVQAQAGRIEISEP